MERQQRRTTVSSSGYSSLAAAAGCDEAALGWQADRAGTHTATPARGSSGPRGALAAHTGLRGAAQQAHRGLRDVGQGLVGEEGHVGGDQDVRQRAQHDKLAVPVAHARLGGVHGEVVEEEAVCSAARTLVCRCG